jgi:hypothetical protein
MLLQIGGQFLALMFFEDERALGGEGARREFIQDR